MRAIGNAVLHHRRDQLRMVGSAQLNDGRQLIGLEASLGTRRYLLNLDAEAIYVLAVHQSARPTERHTPAPRRVNTTVARPAGS